MKKEFPKQKMIDTVRDDYGAYNVVEDEIIETTRWSIVHRLVFEDEFGDFYKTLYSVGATEYQDESPFEYANDMIECTKVEPVEVTTIVYKAVE